jgi:hypothetical protein
LAEAAAPTPKGTGDTLEFGGFMTFFAITPTADCHKKAPSEWMELLSKIVDCV